MKGVVIVARRRTGTNWLSELITTNAHNLREILKPQTDRQGEFFRCLEDVIREIVSGSDLVQSLMKAVSIKKLISPTVTKSNGWPSAQGYTRRD